MTAEAKARGVLTVMDNTFASPVNQTPLELGVDIVVHSGTKYLAGHSDLCCGALLASSELVSRIRKCATSLGGSLDAAACSLLERSLKTIALRVRRQSENAARIAAYLEGRPEVRSVNYPGLPSHPGHRIAAAQMKGFGGMLSFELDAALSVRTFLEGLQLIRPALSLGGVESTICDPATTSHQKVSEEVRRRQGVTPNLLRLSVGIEDADDLVEDLAHALASAGTGR